MKRFENKVVLSYAGKPLESRDQKDETMEIKLINVFWAILNNATFQTQNDSIQGCRLAIALDNATDIIEMEDGVHDWLKVVADKICPTLFRVNGHIITTLVKEGFIKPEDVK